MVPHAGLRRAPQAQASSPPWLGPEMKQNAMNPKGFHHFLALACGGHAKSTESMPRTRLRHGSAGVRNHVFYVVPTWFLHDFIHRSYMGGPRRPRGARPPVGGRRRRPGGANPSKYANLYIIMCLLQKPLLFCGIHQPPPFSR